MRLASALILLLAREAFADPTSTAAQAAPSKDSWCGDDPACVEAKRRELEAIEGWRPSGADPEAEGGDLPSLGYVLFKMIVVLGAVSLLAYLSLGKLLPKLMRVQAPTANRRILEVVDRLPIDHRRSIMIIRTGPDLYFLVGVTDQGISMLSRLDAGEVGTAIAAEPAPAPSLSRFAHALLGRSQKEG